MKTGKHNPVKKYSEEECYYFVIVKASKSLIVDYS